MSTRESVDLGVSTWARFDDALSGKALAFARPDDVVCAWTHDEVLDALRRVEDATASGMWAYGFLAYEAAAGLDGDVTPSAPRPGLPLVWFGIAGAPRRTSVPDVVLGERQYWAAPWTVRWSPERHRKAVEIVQDVIAAGDAYQVNVTGEITGRVLGDELEFYVDLVHAQAGRYNAFVDLGSHVLISASPELFFEWCPPLLRCRPMKGTAPRGVTAAEDEANRGGLAGSAKEAAENIMIVDLIRNDLGKLAATGTVRVPRLLGVERYGSVWQLTSDVTAEPRDATTLIDILTALFPSGSITGAPKLAAMRVIGEVEDGPRGAYCGAIGWVAPPGEPVRSRFNVGIRTVTVDRGDRSASYGAGGGITAPSDPAAEYAEMIAKTALLGLAGATRADPPLELLETFAYRADPGFGHLDRHLARLAASAAEFGLPYDDDHVRSSLAESVRGRDEARVGLRLATDGRVSIRLDPLPASSRVLVRLVVDSERVRSDLLWLRHKTNRRAVYDQARARRPSADDVVLVNERGELTESTIATLALRVEGRWLTPSLESGCLPGVGRAVAIELGELTEHRLTLADLERCDQLALISSLRGWRQARLG